MLSSVSYNTFVNNTINNYNTNNTKVLTYKDKFKIEKEKNTKLESILDDKLNKYNNYQTLVIDKINNDFKNKIDQLNLDILNANKRLTVIKIRMNKEYENNKKRLQMNIESTKLDIIKHNESINNINNEIKIINTNSEKINLVNNELDVLKHKIIKCKENIKLIEKDLSFIVNTQVTK